MSEKIGDETAICPKCLKERSKIWVGGCDGALVWECCNEFFNPGAVALATRQPDPALAAAQAEVAWPAAGGWSYDFGPRKVPNGLIEVAFETGLGDFYVRICEQKITRNRATHDRPLPVEEYEYGYFDEYGKDASSGKRPYAWRRITVPLSREARAALTVQA